MAEPTTPEIQAAIERGEALMRGPRAVAARYDVDRDRIVVDLTDGREIAFAPGDAQGLETASAEDLRAVQVDALGLGLHFPTVDADLYVPALVDGIMGSIAWIARRAAQRAAE